MARMYPDNGSKENESSKAEPLLYEILRQQLDDSFHVAHSIPWLSSVVKEVLNDKSDIGEIDFLVFNAQLGILAIEVKGGNIRHDFNGFYYSKSYDQRPSRIDPVTQLNRGVFALQKWFREHGLDTKLAKAFFFPESVFPINQLPPGYKDFNQQHAVSLVIDKKDIGRVGERIKKIMQFHKQYHGTKPLTELHISKIIEMILPTSDASPCWISRVGEDNYLWLRFTDEQNECVRHALVDKRFIVNGWPGSGKTVVAVQAARELYKKGKKVLMITYNRLLADNLRKNLEGVSDVYTLYKLAWEIDKIHERSTGQSIEPEAPEIVRHFEEDEKIVLSIRNGYLKNFFEEYDCLIVDEGQVIWEKAWCELKQIFESKKIIVMCDATQAFEYEKPVTLSWLEHLLNVNAFTLTSSLRVPRKVCDRLKLFTRPNYIVHNPRRFEEDTLSELVVSSPKFTLKELISVLISDGIPKNYITVLKPTFLRLPDEIVPNGVRVENIGRFRGLESPIVIIAADPKMTNSEFFVAYSRATSKCISIFDAYHVKQGDYGAIGPELYNTDPSSVQSELNNSFTSVIYDKLGHSNEVIHSALPLYWSESWKSYVLMSTSSTSELIRALLEAYLRIENTPEVFTWNRDSRGTLSLIPRKSIGLTNQFFSDLHEIKGCPSCEKATPHAIRLSSMENCTVCNNTSRGRNFLFEKSFYEMAGILTGEKHTSSDERKKLSPYIYILGAFIKLENIEYPEDILSVINDAVKPINRLALAFSLRYLMARYKKGDVKVRIRDVTEKTFQWNANISSTNKQSWNAYVNDSFRVFEMYKVVKTQESGYRNIVKAPYIISKE